MAGTDYQIAGPRLTRADMLAAAPEEIIARSRAMRRTAVMLDAGNIKTEIMAENPVDE
jgi:hypothetical protein